MFGPRFNVSRNGLDLTLRTIRKEEAKLIAEGISNPRVQLYLHFRHGETVQQAEEWLQKAGTDENEVVWGIALAKDDRLIGSTSLGFLLRNHTAHSGVMIFDPSMWGKGVVSLTHLVRTMYAADWLDVATIISSVRKPNDASRKALERVGYAVIGTEYRTSLVSGELIDTYHLEWVNPAWQARLFKDEVPELFREPLQKAEVALKLARELVKTE